MREAIKAKLEQADAKIGDAYRSIGDDKEDPFGPLDEASAILKCIIDDPFDVELSKRQSPTFGGYLHINGHDMVPMHITQTNDHVPCLHIGDALMVFLDRDQLAQLASVIDVFIGVKAVRDAAG